MVRGAWRAGEDAVTRPLPLLSLRPKPRAAQNATFGKGAVVPGFGSDDDDTAQWGLLSPWGAYRGQLWAAPPTWPAMPLWVRRAQHWQQHLLMPGSLHGQCKFLDVRNRRLQTVLACNRHA